MPELRRDDLIFPDLSYQIVGCAFEVYNNLGAGHQELTYHKALAKEFETQKIKFKDEVYFPVQYKNENVGKNFFDFLVNDSIIVEIKQGVSFSNSRMNQVLNYLIVSKLKLAILITFGSTRVMVKRVLNIQDHVANS